MHMYSINWCMPQQHALLALLPGTCFNHTNDLQIRNIRLEFIINFYNISLIKTAQTVRQYSGIAADRLFLSFLIRQPLENWNLEVNVFSN